jgi:hypothetical protein
VSVGHVVGADFVESVFAGAKDPPDDPKFGQIAFNCSA